MPTLWVHNIRNVGDSELVTMFWADQLLDPENPDQYPETIARRRPHEGHDDRRHPPEIIRLARVIDALDATEGIEHVLVHTGQNYDHQLNQVFFDDLGLRAPDHYLGVDTSAWARSWAAC